MRRAILFDFDGVIVESVNIKTDAFRELFANEEEMLPAILDLHLRNGGMSRFAKFELIYRDILGRELDALERERLACRFSELVVNGVIKCPLVPGAVDFLERYAETLRLFVASATPEAELQYIMEQRGLLRYFREVHGAPNSKTDIARSILRRHGWVPAEMVFVGDACNDLAAACEVGLPFIGRVRVGEVSPFPAAVPVVEDLGDLESQLNGNASPAPQLT